MTALVTKEDIEGVLLRPFLIPRISTFEQLLQQVTETLRRTLLDVVMQGEANTPRQYETTCGSRFLIVDPFH